MPINDVDKLRAAYVNFRHDPLANFIVHVRQQRAGQIRTLLADPESLPDVETFDREVWCLESRTYLHSHRIDLQLYFKYYEQTKLLKTMAEQNLKIHDLEKALLAGQLELHGNYIYGQSTGTFAPMIKDQALRFSLLKQALHTFNDATLTASEQALLVYNTKGFGENNATGLGMIFHPQDIGIVNAAT
ncbi:hypothetical protein [Dictyobacter arantiisoli]|uniref:Uncharacterized protein n=1 Tax=Dictyobacter arantiisoli TaxID=2014874 RepID=A0A5A5TID4_9CHLR|nr:hypothetical protein [Dictyobacter arantiisoli]GCF11082.1 hypothetical protein KDI_46460 [Dictyobacter arantiisoli]